MLVVKNIQVSYGSIKALRGTSLEVNSGEIVTVIGANGAGKTTLLMTISGILHPHDGEIYFMGKRIDRSHPHEVVRMGISQVPEGRRIFPDLTVEENLRAGAITQSSNKSQISSDYELVLEMFPVLKERARQLAGTLSGGEQQMLAIGRALMVHPKLLLLDEPSMGLAPILVTNIFSTLCSINQRGMTILVVEQNAHKALSVAQRGYVLEGGRIVIDETADELLRDDRIKQAYLGADLDSAQV